jgi:hypothetical protein
MGGKEKDGGRWGEGRERREREEVMMRYKEGVGWYGKESGGLEMT